MTLFFHTDRTSYQQKSKPKAMGEKAALQPQPNQYAKPKCQQCQSPDLIMSAHTKTPPAQEYAEGVTF